MSLSAGPDSQPLQSTTGKKGKRQKSRTQLYGYLLTRDWMADYWRRHELGGPGHGVDIQSKVTSQILPLAGLSKLYSVKWDGNPGVDKSLAVAVGHKKPSGEVILASRERIDKVKRALETDEEPSWHEMF